MKHIPYKLESLRHDGEGLYMSVIHTKTRKKISVRFNGWIALHQYTAIEHYTQNLPTTDLMTESTPSSLLNWLNKESCGISDYVGYTHYRYITQQGIIDVITGCKPTIS